MVEPPAPEGLGHWTEPATGEVPIMFGDDAEPPSGEIPAAPRFRSGGSDWDESELETFRVLGEEPEDEPPPRGAGAAAGGRRSRVRS